MSLGTKFRLKLTVLIFWTKFAQKAYFWSKKETIIYAKTIIYEIKSLGLVNLNISYRVGRVTGNRGTEVLFLTLVNALP